MNCLKFYFDTYALIEIIKGNANYQTFSDEEIVTSALNIGELYYALLRESDEKTAEYWSQKFSATALDAHLEEIIPAMKLRFENKEKKFSYIDCIGYIMAKKRELVFLTGDQAFKEMPNVRFVK